MKINSYNNQDKYFNIKEEKQQNASAENNNNNNNKELKNISQMNQTDSIEISDTSKQLNSVKNKIKSGFYDNPDILKKTAEKMLNHINIEM